MNKFDMVIDELEKGARILEQDKSDIFLECLCNSMREKGLGEIIVQAIKLRLLINRRKRENRLVKVRANL